MVDNENQGNFRKDEQQWTCSDCETINTGEYCTVCGCPRPQKKQEDNPQQTATEQGSYQEAVQEWICPDCETHNTGTTCIVCGRPRPDLKVKKGSISKKAMIAAAAAVVVISSLAGITAWFPNHCYQNACRLLESGQYEQAYQAFSVIALTAVPCEIRRLSNGRINWPRTANMRKPSIRWHIFPRMSSQRRRKNSFAFSGQRNSAPLENIHWP